MILETMAMSGMRLGEALAMCWENLDTRNCQYNVAETTRHGRFGPPKSGKRLIDLDETLVGKLDTHIKKLEEGRPGDRGASSLPVPWDHPAHGARGLAPGLYGGPTPSPQPP